jgi:hypothetical protein
MFENMEFAAHGSFEMRVEGQIIFTSVQGPYNQELALNHSLILHSLSLELKRNGPWIEIITFSKSALFTPRAAEVHRKGVIAAKNDNIAAFVFVMDNDVEGRQLAISLFTEIFAPYCPVQFCSNLESAVDFSHKLLSDIKNSS